LQKLPIFALLVVLLVGGFYFMRSGGMSDRAVAGGRAMMGGRGMGRITIPGQEPPQETNKKYLAGYEQAKITCTQCHALPPPNQHTRAEWPGVIARMKGHIKTYGKVMPTAAQLKSIVGYYVANFSDGGS